MQDAKLITKNGTVVRKMFSPGSKSQHYAFYLITEKDEWVLRIRGENSFENKFFEPYENKKVECRGSESSYVLFVEEIKIA